MALGVLRRDFVVEHKQFVDDSFDQVGSATSIRIAAAGLANELSHTPQLTVECRTVEEDQIVFWRG